MWKKLTLLTLFRLSHLTLAQTTEDGPIVDLGYAQYQGVFNDTTNVTTFNGIRYASAPVGMWARSPPLPGF